MQTATFSAVFFFGCLVGSAFAQTTTLIHGHKVLVDKRGQIVAPPAPTQPPPAPLVGGADSCTTPDVITGTGSFAFDTSVASTGAEGQNEGACLAFGFTAIEQDVWFTWTAGFSGYAQVQTCAGSILDTKIAVYSGSTCPSAGSALACNDDYCGVESSLWFPVTSGNAYVIQMGNFQGSAGGSSTFTLNPFTPQLGDDCSAPIAISGPGTHAFDISNTTTGPQQVGVCSTLEKDIWFQYAATSNGAATVTTCGQITSTDNDTVLAAYNGGACPSSGPVICNDDSCGLKSTISFATTCGNTYMIQLGAYDTNDNIVGSMSIVESGMPCGPAGTPFCFGDGSGTACPCGNAGAAGNGCASSVNANGAHLTTSGSASIANDTLVLQGTGMANSSCLYFQGTTQVSTAFGDGLRCAGGTIVRLGTKINAGGASQYPSGADASVHVKGTVTTPGSLRTYQTWYRNAAPYCTASTFNLTNGIQVTWQ